MSDAPATINAIIRSLEDRCQNNDGPDVILATLQRIHQAGTLTNFTDEVERLTTQLETLYVAENIPKGRQPTPLSSHSQLVSKIQKKKLILKAGQQLKTN